MTEPEYSHVFIDEQDEHRVSEEDRHILETFGRKYLFRFVFRFQQNNLWIHIQTLDPAKQSNEKFKNIRRMWFDNVPSHFKSRIRTVSLAISRLLNPNLVGAGALLSELNFVEGTCRENWRKQNVIPEVAEYGTGW